MCVGVVDFSVGGDVEFDDEVVGVLCCWLVWGFEGVEEFSVFDVVGLGFVPFDSLFECLDTVF